MKIGSLLKDFRVAARRLFKNKALSVGAMTCFALGIGVNLTVVDLTDRLLFRSPPHVEDIETLFQVRYSMELPGIGAVTASTFSQPTFLDLADSPGVQGLAAEARMRLPAVPAESGDTAEPIDVGLVSASYFPLLGVRPARGRFFDESEVAENDPVAVLTPRTAERWFAEPEESLGRTIRVAGSEHTVIGLVPRGFRGVEVANVDLWLPNTALGTIQGGDWRNNRRAKSLHLLARVDDRNAAREIFTGVYRRVNNGITPFVAGSNVTLEPIRRIGGRGGTRVADVLAWLAALSVLVLLIACTNVAGILIVQALRQRKDLALRMALGAGRSTAVRPVIAEIILLVGAGGLISVCLLRWIQDGALRFLTRQPVPVDRILDLRSLALAGAIVLVAISLSTCAALFGFRRLKLASVLAEEAPAIGHVRLPKLLVAAQVALSVILLIGAGLFVRSLYRISMIDIGFDPDGLLVATLESGGDDRDRGELLARFAETVDRFPWVERVAVGAAVPFNVIVDGGGLKVPGIDVPSRMPGGGPYVDAVTPGYFDTMGIRVLRGQSFASDPRSRSSVIVNETGARVLWPEEEAIGKCIIVPDTGSDVCRTVIGVVAETARQTLEDQPAIQVYLRSSPGEWPEMGALFVKAAPTALDRTARSLRSEMQADLPAGWLAEVQPMQSLIAPELRPWKLGTHVFVLFGTLGLVLACIGLSTSVGQTVAGERQAIGVRMALGAEQSQVVRLVVRDSLLPVAIGTLLGIALAYGGSLRLAPLLHEVSPHDPFVYAAVAVVVLITTGLTSYLSARDAARVDPVAALRGE